MCSVCPNSALSVHQECQGGDTDALGFLVDDQSTETNPNIPANQRPGCQV
jgi:hypothetical protein